MAKSTDEKTISKPLDYEKRLERARDSADEGAEIMEDAKTALASLRKDVLGRRSQAVLLEHCRDAMVAMEHMKVTKGRLEAIAKAAKSAKTDASAIADEADHLLWGIEVHYGDLLSGQLDLGGDFTKETLPPEKKGQKKKARGASEEGEKKDPAPGRAPKDIPGINAAELATYDAPATLRELGLRYAKDDMELADPGDEMQMQRYLGSCLSIMNEGTDVELELTDEEEAELLAGLADGIRARGQKEEQKPAEELTVERDPEAGPEEDEGPPPPEDLIEAAQKAGAEDKGGGYKEEKSAPVLAKRLRPDPLSPAWQRACLAAYEQAFAAADGPLTKSVLQATEKAGMRPSQVKRGRGRPKKGA